MKMKLMQRGYYITIDNKILVLMEYFFKEFKFFNKILKYLSVFSNKSLAGCIIKGHLI